jgi:hypothetical protein
MTAQFSSDDAPILIIGPQRSGSTLLATMLNAHPRIFIANEAKVFVGLLPGADSNGTSLSKEVVAEILRDLEKNEMAHHAPLPDAGQVLADMDPPTVPSLIRSLFRLLAVREGKERWGEKTAVAYRQLDEIRRSFPEARLIGLDRDPWQIAASYEKKIPKWGAIGGLVHWIDYRRALARQDANFQIHIVSYEKLITKPEETLRELCAYLGEDFSPMMLEFHRTERASKLRTSSVFSGVSRPLFVPPEPSPHLRRGIQSRLIQTLIDIGHSTNSQTLRPGIWERTLRVGLFIRASLWELRSREFRARLFRAFANRKRAWRAARQTPQ